MASTIKVLTGAVLALQLGMTAVGVAGAALPQGQAITLGKQTAAQTAELTRGNMVPGSTVHVPAGYELPIAIGMRGDLAVTVEPVVPVKLRARRDLWVRFNGDSVDASLDGVHFKPVPELMTGTISFALSAEENGSNLHGELSAEIRTRAE